MTRREARRASQGRRRVEPGEFCDRCGALKPTTAADHAEVRSKVRSHIAGTIVGHMDELKGFRAQFENDQEFVAATDEMRAIIAWLTAKPRVPS